MSAKTKSLFGYIFPAMGGLFVTYLYNVVDVDVVVQASIDISGFVGPVGSASCNFNFKFVRA